MSQWIRGAAVALLVAVASPGGALLTAVPTSHAVARPGGRPTCGPRTWGLEKPSPAHPIGFFPDPALQDEGGGGWELWSDGEVDPIPVGVTPCYGDLVWRHVHVDDVVSMLASPAGTGYYLLGRDGGVFALGAVPFLGSVVGDYPGNSYPALGMSWCGPDVGAGETPQGYVVQVNPFPSPPGLYFPFRCSG